MSPDEIRELRRRRGWTHEELGASVYASEISAIRWEAGATQPRPNVEKRLLELLQASRLRDARMAARKIRRKA